MGEPMMASDKDAQTAEEQERGYWLYVPGEGAGKWEEFRTAGIMALNWDRIGDPTSYPNEEAVIEALEAWRGDPDVAAVLIDHAEGRGFCAGARFTPRRRPCRPASSRC